jgi:benzoate-CoA ligase family protein
VLKKLRIGILGAGPAGLLLALLIKRRRPDHQILIVEQNPPEATFGFGVVFSQGALGFLERDEPEIHRTLAGEMESWPVQKIVHRDESVVIDGNGFSAVARLTLIGLLQRLAQERSVRLELGRALDSLAAFDGFDLVVGADGVNSLVRRLQSERFEPRIEHLTNKFAWYGTEQVFECLTLTFRANEHGAFVAHHYRYSPRMSTFIVECDAATWYRAGLDRMTDEQSRAYCERVFAPDLGGRALMSNRSIWRNFPLLYCRNWTVDNVVLIGDALRTGHFSIGSGTRLAFEDAIALERALAACEDVAEALRLFERERRPVVDKLVAAANKSSFWYERFADKMQLEPWELAYDYMTRSGRMSDERLRETAPAFMSMVEARRDADPDAEARREGRVADAVPHDAPGAREIEFRIPDRYNASSILFDNLEAGRGDKVAVVCEGRPTSYGDLCATASRVGHGLNALGLTRGQRVLLLMYDTPQLAAAIFGAIRAGFVPVLVNTLSPPELVAYYLRDSGAEVAIISGDLAKLVTHEEVRASRLRHLVLAGDGAQELPPCLHAVHTWHQWAEAQPAELPAVDTHRDEMAFWMYSSGSTGRPKGVVHLQHDPAYTFESYGRRALGIREDDVVFSPPKIFFAYGFGNSLTFPFSIGATAVLHPGRPDAESVLSVIERDRPTILFGLPTLYSALLSHSGSEKRDLSSLRLCVSAAEVLSSEMFREWQRRYGLSIVEGLGSTEVLHMYLSNRIDKPKPGASGARVPGYEIRLTDTEGHAVPGGESGLMWVRGDSSAPMYWNRPDKTQETMRGGWIWTGDRFHEDEDGYYYFEGRADDLIKVSGQWIHPLEVERCLAEHPAVGECAVLGVEDANRLMTLKAWVALRPGILAHADTTRALQDFVKQRLLPYKYPRVVEYLETLPKTGTGKIDRQALRRLSSFPAGR